MQRIIASAHMRYEILTSMLKTAWKLDKNWARYQRIVHEIIQNIQNVETFAASHRNQLESPITSQSQVNYLQRLCRALMWTYLPSLAGFRHVASSVVSSGRANSNTPGPRSLLKCKLLPYNCREIQEILHG